MKNNFLLLTLLTLALPLMAQQDCSDNRYQQPVFNTVDVSSDIQYGSAGGTDLYLDFYEPQGDVLEKRPLIILAFGGSFVFGNRTSPDVVDLCTQFTEMGYTCASIDYRLTTSLLWDGSWENAYRAVMKGAHDMKGSVRYFHANEDTYGIDTTNIYVGGVSAGAIAAVHLGYLDDLDEVPSEIYQEFVDNGGVEGNSGNTGFSSDVAGIINLCGALGDDIWLNTGDEPIVSVHGDQDDVVPYGDDVLTTLGINLPLAGSSALHARALEVAVKSNFYTFYGAGHTPFVSSDAYMDTTVLFVRDFLYEEVCSNSVGVFDVNHEMMEASISPNPTQGTSLIRWNEIGDYTAIVTDLQGRRISRQFVAQNNAIELSSNGLAKGIYLVRLVNNQGALAWTGKWSVQ